MNIYEELLWRGLVFQYSKNTEKILQNNKITVYAGFDPTSDSLHIGNLIPLITLKRFKDFGHKIIILAGGGTSLIGDPSGKSNERNLLDIAQVKKNLTSIKPQLTKIIGLDEQTQLLNNTLWLSKLKFISFLRHIGKNFPVNQMLQKESVDSRLKANGISYTEFTYMLMQAYDFYYLNKEYDCTVQIGGSDQWGNMVSGIELIRRLNKNKTYCLTLPLVLSSDGEKFGKSEKGAIYLDPKKTTPYEFYQYWLNVSDSNAIKFLKLFTFLNRKEILSLEKELPEKAHLRNAQKTLAKAMTQTIHSKDECSQVINATEVLFGKKDIKSINKKTFEMLNQATGGKTYNSLNQLSLTKILIDTQLCHSGRNAREMIKSNAVSINNQKIKEENYLLNTNDLKQKKFIIIKKGKKEFCVVKITN